MKFFKKLNNSNNQHTKKLLFLKNSKKKTNDGKVELASSANKNESWLELNLPNDFSASFDIPQFDGKLDDCVSNTSTTVNTSSVVVAVDYNSTLYKSNTGESQNSDSVSSISLVEEKIVNDLNVKQPLNVLQTRDFESQISEKVLVQQQNLDEKIVVVNPSNDGNEDRKDQQVLNKEGLSQHGNVMPSCITGQLESFEYISKRLAEKEEQHILSSDKREASVDAQVITDKATPQIEEQVQPSGLKSGDKYTEEKMHSKDEILVMDDAEKLQSIANKKKDVDKRRSMQSFIPRKQFQPGTKEEEEEKKMTPKEKKRQSSHSSIPVPSSVKITNNRLSITTDMNNANDYDSNSANISSPSSTTSTSTTTTNMSDNSNSSIKKQKNKQLQQQLSQSKIPVANNLISVKPIQNSGNHHHISKLPKKITNI